VSLESTKADDIAVLIEEAIVSGELTPGSVLRQEQLSERFGVSRTPVREALRKLAALGLVSFEPNRGVRVRTLSHDDLREAFLVRAELEALVTEIAAQKITPEALEELGECESRFSRLTKEVRSHEPGGGRRSLMSEWMRAKPRAVRSPAPRCGRPPTTSSTICMSATRPSTARFARPSSPARSPARASSHTST
jgi:DNA-binding transcriptional regulator YhcF (GntR family)